MLSQHLNQSEILRQFADAIYCNTGATIYPIPDSELHRFDDPEGKRGNLSGWYVLHVDHCPAGAYGSWRTGISYTWRIDTGQRPDPAEQHRIAALVRAARDRRDRERTEAQAKAAIRAQALWGAAMPATVAHPYIAAKQIPALGLRQSGAVLLVALRNIAGEVVNLQRIAPDGTKRFLPGGRVTGCFGLIGEIPEAGELYIAEGWATAMSIHKTLRVPVVAAMNAGNLKPVAMAIRTRYPRLALVIAADNDHKTPGNPGYTKGREAAMAVSGAACTFPTVCMEHDCTCTDFNDTAHCPRADR